MNKKFCLIFLLFIFGAFLPSRGANVPSLQSYMEFSFLKRNISLVKQAFGLDYLNPAQRTEVIKEVYNNPAYLPPISIAMLADTVFEHDKDLALLFFSVSYIRTGVDVHMCNDEAGLELLDLFPYLAPNTHSYALSNQDFYMEAAIKAMKWSDEHPQYYNHYWACSSDTNPFYSGKKKPHPEEKFDSIMDEIRLVFKLSEQLMKGDLSALQNIKFTIK